MSCTMSYREDFHHSGCKTKKTASVNETVSILWNNEVYLSEDVFDDLSVYIGQAEIPTLKLVSELLMIDA